LTHRVAIIGKQVEPNTAVGDFDAFIEFSAFDGYGIGDIRKAALGKCFRFGEGLKFFEKRILCAPEASPGLKMIAANRLQWLDGQMAGKDYICGKRFTMADILLYCWLDFGGTVGQPLDQSNGNIVAWMARVAERPSAKA